MKTHTLLSILIISSIFYFCSKETEITPTSNVKQNNVQGKNLRPQTLPDLQVYSFAINGNIIRSGETYLIPYACKERNSGTETATGQDSLFVYQRVEFNFLGRRLFINQKVGTHLRQNQMLLPNHAYGFYDTIRIPANNVSKNRLIHLIIEADGAKNILESNENNNFSATIWSVYIP